MLELFRFAPRLRRRHIILLAQGERDAARDATDAWRVSSVTAMMILRSEGPSEVMRMM